MQFALAVYFFIAIFSAISCFFFTPQKAHAENLSLASLDQTIVTMPHEILELQSSNIVHHIESLRDDNFWREVIQHPLSHPDLEEHLANCLTYAKQLQADLEESMHFISNTHEFEEIQKLVEMMNFKQTRIACLKLREQGFFSSEMKVKGKGITKEYLVALINHCKIYKPKLVLSILKEILDHQVSIVNA